MDLASLRTVSASSPAESALCVGVASFFFLLACLHRVSFPRFLSIFALDQLNMTLKTSLTLPLSTPCTQVWPRYTDRDFLSPKGNESQSLDDEKEGLEFHLPSGRSFSPSDTIPNPILTADAVYHKTCRSESSLETAVAFWKVCSATHCFLEGVHAPHLFLKV